MGSSAEEILTESLQIVEKSSSDDAPGEVTRWQERSAQEDGTFYREKPDLKESERTVIDNIFTEIQQLSGRGIISQLIEVLQLSSVILFVWKMTTRIDQTVA